MNDVEFISNNKAHINLNFLGDFTPDEIVQEVEKYLIDNKNNPIIFGDYTCAPEYIKRFKIVRAKLF